MQNESQVLRGRRLTPTGLVPLLLKLPPEVFEAIEDEISKAEDALPERCVLSRTSFYVSLLDLGLKAYRAAQARKAAR